MIKFQFASIGEFLLMDPHGVYVWSTYLLGLLVLGGLAYVTHSSHRAAIRTIRRQFERENSNESET